MDKEKGVVIADCSSDEEIEEKKTEAVPAARFFSRNASSKYDFIKIPNHVAVKIALELKKLLIDNSLLDMSQSN